MGYYQKGILGGFNGKIGTVIGATWKGIDYMKSRPRKSNKPATQAQLIQQAKFILLTKFINGMSKLLMLGFKESGPKMTGLNKAFVHLYDDVITGAYPAFAIDFSKVMVSKGQLHNAVNPQVEATGGGAVKFSWTDNSGIPMANPADRSILVVHCPELNRSMYTTAGAERSTGTDTLNVSAFTGKTVETWISFVTADGSDVATSIYTGELTV